MGLTQARGHTSENSPGAGRRAPGLYIGKVIERVDPRQMGRVLIKVPELGGQLPFAWARVLSPFGGLLTGVPIVPPVDAGCMVAFEAEDINRPVVLGGLWFQSGEQSEIPTAAQGTNDPVRAARGKDTTTTADGVVITEPVDPFGAVYPNNIALKTPGEAGAGGHLVELDDTPGVARISLTHFPSTSWLEIHPDGSLVVGVQGQRYVIVKTTDTKHVFGDENVAVEGAARRKVGGEYVLNAKGYRLSSTKKWQIEAISAATLTAKSISMVAATSADIEATSTASLKAAQVTIGPQAAPAPVVTTRTHPVDYITGIPIVGDPNVLAG